MPQSTPLENRDIEIGHYFAELCSHIEIPVANADAQILTTYALFFMNLGGRFYCNM